VNAATGEYTTDNAKDAGVGLKYGINSNLTFDFTYNPDFSQIESDTQQIDINQRFPLQFAELRPFFLEGQEIFNLVGCRARSRPARSGSALWGQAHGKGRQSDVDRPVARRR